MPRRVLFGLPGYPNPTVASGREPAPLDDSELLCLSIPLVGKAGWYSLQQEGTTPNLIKKTPEKGGPREMGLICVGKIKGGCLTSCLVVVRKVNKAW